MTEPLDNIAVKWSGRIARAFVLWSEEERASREIKITPFDPSPLIREAFYAGGYAQLAEIGKMTGMNVSFNIRSKEAEEWISKFSADQIKYISKQDRATIKKIKRIAQQEGLSLGEQRKLIKQHIGLLPNHAVAVRNYEAALLKSGMDEQTAGRLSRKYANKLLNYRATLIGTTEGNTAVNNGQRISNETALKRGVLNNDDHEQEWATTGLKNVCKKCKDANGTRAPIGGKFPNGLLSPPAHPGCHCGTFIVYKLGRGIEAH
jgi:hypothetical protein